MKLHHIAIWTFQLEKLREFYVRYFEGTSNEKYINAKKGFESYFIFFGDGTSLELMSRIDIQNVPFEDDRIGLTHLAFTFPNKEEVLRFTERMRTEGYTIAGEPRTSGDGYFESVILDPDGNRLECVFQKKEEANVLLSSKMMTERLTLRPFQESDVQAIFTSCQNPKLGNNAGWTPHQTLEESREVLHTIFMGQESVWAITLKETQQLIGSIGLIPDPQRQNTQVRMIGYWLDEAYWGKGYMSEAAQAVIKYGFDEFCLNSITATCYPHNERSQKVLKRNGFIYEGTLHQATTTYDGHTYDLFCYYLPNEYKSIL